MIRVQAVVLPILRAALNAHLAEEGSEAPAYDRSRTGVSVVSQMPDVDYRTMPMVVVRRDGGSRNPNLPQRHSLPAVTLEVYSADGLVEAEELYDEAIDALYDAVADQAVVPGVGYLQSVPEAHEGAPAASELPDTWKVTGSARLSLRGQRS